MKYVDPYATTIIEQLPQPCIHQHRTGADSQDRTKGTGEGTPNSQALPGPSKTKRRIALLVFALLVCAAAAVYYFRFVAPFESTDHVFIEGHVKPMASQVLGRIVGLPLKDNQAIQPAGHSGDPWFGLQAAHAHNVNQHPIVL